MRKFNRRTLMAAGTTLAAGGLFGTTSAAADEHNGDNGESDEGGGGSADFERPDGVAWRYDGPYGDSRREIVATDGRIYTLADGGVYALDADDGSQVWETGDIGAETEIEIQGDIIYVAGDPIQALDAETGEVRWESEVTTDEFEGIGVLEGDTLYVSGDRIQALDAETGEVRWESEVSSSPVRVRHGRVYTADDTVYALDAEDGSIEWERDSVEGETIDGDEVTIEEPQLGDVTEDGIYVGGHRGLAELDPETGETEIMRGGSTHAIVAGSGHLAISPGYDQRYILEMESLETTTSVGPAGNHTIIGDTHFAVGEPSAPHTLTATGLSETAEHLWERDDVLGENADLPEVVGNTVISAFATGPSTSDVDEHWVIALDRDTGEEQWRYTFDTPEGEMETGSLSLLTLDENTIYVSHDGEMVALRSEEEEEEPEEEEPDEEPEEEDPVEEDSSLELSVSAPDSIVRGGSASFDVRVWNRGDSAAEVTISLEVGCHTDSSTVEIAPGDCYASFHSVPCGDLSMGGNEWTVTTGEETESGTLTLEG